jgi:membrane associated rhomboid family serine protease
MTHAGLRFSLPLPPATKFLFLANLAVFVANALLFGRLSEPESGGWFAFSWPGLADGWGLGCLRVLTYQFTHSFRDVMHLLTNMIALWVFAPLAEARLGSAGTVRLYLWAGFAGACGHLLAMSLQGTTAVSLVGASGACYGLMVYAACAAPHQTIVFFIVQMPLWVLAALLTGIGAYATFVELATGGVGGVAHSAHLGGALLGFVAHRLGWFRSWRADADGIGTGLWQRLAGAVRHRRAMRTRRRARARELQLDGILAKVKTHGIGALRADERRFLERASEHARGRDS